MRYDCTKLPKNMGNKKMFPYEACVAVTLNNGDYLDDKVKVETLAEAQVEIDKVREIYLNGKPGEIFTWCGLTAKMENIVRVKTKIKMRHLSRRNREMFELRDMLNFGMPGATIYRLKMELSVPNYGTTERVYAKSLEELNDLKTAIEQYFTAPDAGSDDTKICIGNTICRVKYITGIKTRIKAMTIPHFDEDDEDDDD